MPPPTANKFAPARKSAARSKASECEEFTEEVEHEDANGRYRGYLKYSEHQNCEGMTEEQIASRQRMIAFLERKQAEPATTE